MYKVVMSARTLRHLICRMLVAAVVFAHTAVASYGCSRLPGTPTAVQLHAAMVAGAVQSDAATQHDAPTSSDANGAMEHDAMSHMVPGLCVGHCQLGNQSADHAPAPSVSPALLTTLYVLAPADRGSEPQIGLMRRPTQGSPPPADPPHTILHCCLRD